jgi:hypothetical protein
VKVLSILIRMMHATTVHLESVRPLCLWLRRRQLLSLPDACGVKLVCDSGAVWVTLDNDPRDVVLQAGEHFTAVEHRRALIYALEGAHLTLRPRLAQDAAATAVQRPRVLAAAVPA